MQINELPASSALNATDVFAKDTSGTTTEKITAANMAASMAALSGQQLTPSAAFSIPAAGNSVSYNMAGMTASHILTHWNFSSSPENAPPANLTWTTYAGYFTITNNGGTTAETIKPVFELPTNVSITGI